MASWLLVLMLVLEARALFMANAENSSEQLSAEELDVTSIALLLSNTSSNDQYLRRRTTITHYLTPKVSLEEAQEEINCEKFMQPIRDRRAKCRAKTRNVEVDACVYFASDYEFVVPFLVHHLALGFSHIFIFNNDDRVGWYNHPAVTCMMAERMVEIQPWLGDSRLLKGLNACFKKQIPEIRGKSIEKPEELLNVWGANFDIDEMLVLHDHECVGEMLQDVKAPTLAVNWAFFIPEFPLDDFGRTGNLAFMPHRDYDLHGVVLPHDRLQKRMFENQHVKSINRIGCIGGWHHEHCPTYNELCPAKGFGDKPIDNQGHYIDCQPWTPWVDNYYPVVQLNHYWTLSLHDFLRKIHRGKGGSYSKTDGTQYRSSHEFFAHATAKDKDHPFVKDTSLVDKYGPFYEDLKQRCPKCFDVSYHFLQ